MEGEVSGAKASDTVIILSQERFGENIGIQKNRYDGRGRWNMKALNIALLDI